MEQSATCEGVTCTSKPSDILPHVIVLLSDINPTRSVTSLNLSPARCNACHDSPLVHIQKFLRGCIMDYLSPMLSLLVRNSQPKSGRWNWMKNLQTTRMSHHSIVTLGYFLNGSQRLHRQWSAFVGTQIALV